MVNFGLATNHNTLVCNSDPQGGTTNDKSLPAGGSWAYWSYGCFVGGGATYGTYDLLGALRSGTDWNNVLDDTRTGANTTDFAAGAWKTGVLTVMAPDYEVSLSPGNAVTEYAGNPKSTFLQGETVLITLIGHTTTVRRPGELGGERRVRDEP